MITEAKFIFKINLASFYYTILDKFILHQGSMRLEYLLIYVILAFSLVATRHLYIYYFFLLPFINRIDNKHSKFSY